MAGFEPTNAGVKVQCLTTWLHPYFIIRLFPDCQCLSTVKRPSALLACVFSFHAVTGLFPSSLEKKGVSRHMDKAAQTLPEAPPTGIKGGV